MAPTFARLLRPRLAWVAPAFVALALAACGDGGEDDACTDGAANCACFANATCLDDLECRDGICVDPAGGGDAGADAGGDASSDIGPPPSCVELVPLRLWRSDPSAVAMLFTADDCVTGDPYPGFGSNDFVLTEDGAPLSSEAVPRILPSEGLRVYVTLLLDLSSSTDPNLAELQAGALNFVEELLVERDLPNVWVGLQAFDGAAAPYELVRWTRDVDALTTRITALESFDGSDPSSTNLNGSLRQAVDSLRAHQQAVVDANFGGVVSTGVTVVFTDGGDTARREDAGLATAAIADARVYDPNDGALPTVSTLAVALRGADYDPTALAALVGGAGFVAEAELAQLSTTFGEVGRRIARRVEGTYLLAYCSPSRAGEHEVALSMASGESNTVSFTFSADGFGGGCSAEFFETACDARACGGFNCGACDDATQVCTGGESGQCVSACVEQNLCSGETITNDLGYSQVCGGGSVAFCDDVCVDVSADRANCGDCGVTCDAPDSTCVAGVCVCPGGGIECSGVCTDVSDDPANCGGCGVICEGDGRECSGGVCLCDGEPCVTVNYELQRLDTGVSLPNHVEFTFRVFERPCPLGMRCIPSPVPTQPGQCEFTGGLPPDPPIPCSQFGGAPVVGLTIDDFTVEEEEAPISPTESLLRLENEQITSVMQTVIVIDNSRSIGDALPTVKDAVRGLVDDLFENQEVAIYVFSETVTLVQDFTSDTSLLNSAIDGIALGASSTNLYGAAVTAAGRLRNEFTSERVLQGTLVLFTDGSDTQGSTTLGEALSATRGIETYTVGLGAEIDAAVLAQLGVSGGYLPAASADELDAVFADIQASVEAQAGNVYRLVYETPRRGGESRFARVGVRENECDERVAGCYVGLSFWSTDLFDAASFAQIGLANVPISFPDFFGGASGATVGVLYTRSSDGTERIITRDNSVESRFRLATMGLLGSGGTQYAFTDSPDEAPSSTLDLNEFFDLVVPFPEVDEGDYSAQSACEGCGDFSAVCLYVSRRGNFLLTDCIEWSQTLRWIPATSFDE